MFYTMRAKQEISETFISALRGRNRHLLAALSKMERSLVELKAFGFKGEYFIDNIVKVLFIVHLACKKVVHLIRRIKITNLRFRFFA